jgi:hypothetical protein
LYLAYKFINCGLFDALTALRVIVDFRAKFKKVQVKGYKLPGKNLPGSQS